MSGLSKPPCHRRSGANSGGKFKGLFFFFLCVAVVQRACRRASALVASGKKKKTKKKKRNRKKKCQKHFFLFSFLFFSLKSWLQPADVQCEEFKSSVTVRRHQKQDSFSLKQQIRLSLSFCRRRRVLSSLVELRLNFHRRRLSTAGRPD